jgi:hypothetical protein
MGMPGFEPESPRRKASHVRSASLVAGALFDLMRFDANSNRIERARQ